MLIDSFMCILMSLYAVLTACFCTCTLFFLMLVDDKILFACCHYDSAFHTSIKLLFAMMFACCVLRVCCHLRMHACTHTCIFFVDFLFLNLYLIVLVTSGYLTCSYCFAFRDVHVALFYLEFPC